MFEDTTDEQTCIREDALEEGEVFYIDGSVMIDQNTGVRHMGAALVRFESGEYDVVAKVKLPLHYNVQAAKRVVLIKAFKLTQGSPITIYSDSAYITTRVHSGLSGWCRRWLKISDGTPVQHALLLSRLNDSLAQHALVALVKYAAQTHNTDPTACDNHAADIAAKEAAYLVDHKDIHASADLAAKARAYLEVQVT
ncbi:ribonuclease H-like [Ambystoma mexicanum]|uniref:ribonuclease H-like n=1 Tax=Ambystoma mexicanum TaxID=8296 RepID=UPI0037E7DE35